MFGGTSADNSGFFQRLNIIASNETRTVAKLKKPIEEMVALAARIAPMIQALDYQKLIVRDSPESKIRFDSWFEDFKARTKQDSGDVRGRLNVLSQRTKNILGWALDDFDVTRLNPKAQEGQEPIPCSPERIVELGVDVIEKAIQKAEYELLIRRANQPVIGETNWVVCENHIIKILKVSSKPLTRSQLYKRIHGERHGIKVFKTALDNLQFEKFVAVTVEGRTKPKELIEWIKDKE